jgi:BASS family bile acid:Na+ symporter
MTMEHRKFTFLGPSQFVHHHLLWFLISAYAIAAVFPTAGLWVRTLSFGDTVVFQTKIHASLLLLLLAVLMFNAGLGAKPSHLKSLLQ